MPEEELIQEIEQEENSEEEEGKQSFTSHLGELRKRIFIALISIIVLFMAAFQYSELLFQLVMLPLKFNVSFIPRYPLINLIPKASVVKLHFLAPTEAFWVHLKVSLIAGVIASSPMLFLQAWKFISPGLHEKEKKMALPFIFTTTGLFLVGTLFCFLAVLPFAMKFLLNFKTTDITPMLSVEKYVDFCLKFILAFGIIFELPVVIVFLTRLGLVTPKTLAKNRKYAVLVAFIVGAALTPPDAFTQTLMAVPMMFLYEAGILASRIFARKKRPDDTREEHQSDGK